MDVLVIGAGVVGLAVARALGHRGHNVIVAEATGNIGNGVSSRNSEVIHAGMYYLSGSLRARHCVHGRRMLYAFCESHRVPYAKCGKLIVATNDLEQAKIEGIYEQGLANGVEGLSFLTGEEARALEPNLACTGAVLSQETGIVDSHALMLALQGDLEAAGGVIAFHTPVERIAQNGMGWSVQVGGTEPTKVVVDAVVNVAGLGAQAVARGTENYPTERVPPLVLAKGNYFGCLGKPAFSRLIYPAPVDGGLGTHVTLDLSGRMRFGPDVEWVEREEYEVDPARAESFYASIRRYWPGLPVGALVPDYCGIRPKLTGPGEKAADFMIDGPAEHGLPSLIHLFGIESPGLTSSLSIAEDVAERLLQQVKGESRCFHGQILLNKVD
ncbi:NAD(P)/FAD-dependent oxidoreductase [Microvirga arabica]|uniref:NAD(P)/FAD-dependent oxidoreductase n=1 Tax=Microvirga arabica TaxID=1128671 RepID=UPI00193A9CDA|nr:NAD(P)/FAD-dependent oxidoreductase [Microvirga arabica]MBM1173548.1 NAD(P)/FAD-dependent oxidoreductase [Microvirga arabica]